MEYRHLLNFWSLVPALDLQSLFATSSISTSETLPADEPFQFYKKRVSNTRTASDNEITKELNCLLVGSSVGCLFKTLARFNRHECDKMNLYVACTFPESLTRNLLLLSLFKNSNLSLLERTEIFLEILGNTYVRASTASYIENTSSEILKSIECPEQDTSLSPLITMGNLKQREIDELVKVLMFLKNKEMPFDVGKAWEKALRSSFRQRYDIRKNIFDYNYNMKLTDYGIINLNKYLDWCETGVAFKFRSSNYNYPNKTMAVQRRDSGQRRNHGVLDIFVGDLATSPFLVFGVESGNPELFRKANNEYISNSGDISKYNIVDMLDEFTVSSKRETLKRIEIHFMFFDTLCKSCKFDHFFDAIYIPCDMMHCSSKLVPKVLKTNGIVVFETLRNMVDSTKEQKSKHSECILRLAHSVGLTSAECDIFNDFVNYKVFKLIN